MRRVALVLCLCAAGAGVTRAETGDWTVHRDPFDRTVVARCKAILAKNPYDSALATLVGIYRKARSVEQLAQEYREEPESWAALVVLARLAEPDHARALSAYKRAVELDDRDYRAWIAIGDASKPEAARPHYERALALSPPAPLRKAVLRKLATLPGAPDVRDRAYARLVERDPNNGTLWTERADSLAAARVFAQAVDCYTQAEALLKRDPERRLYVIAQRGLAHELAGDIDAAVADYKRAIAESPRGYYLKTELVARIIRVHTKANTLPALLREYQRAWPEKSRGHFEWTTLGQLYQATGALDAAILALQAAVAKAPDDLDTQRRLVTLLDAAGRTDDALAQLEAAAKTAPRDVKTQFQLVERYWDKDKPKLLATLGKLSRALPTNPGVHHDIGNLYIKLRRLDLATHEYELVAKLEPDDDNLLLLGDTHWDAGNQDQAVATWNWLARKRTAASYAALGNVLVEHELYEDALVAYSRAIDREPDNAELWRARGAIYEVVKRWGSAVSDTDHAVALLGAASRDAGHAARYQLVRILVTLAEMRDFSGADEANQLEDRVAQWELAFGKGDLIAGYLLAEFYGSSPNARHAAVLEQLHARVPDDAGLTLELVRAYRVFKHYDKAIKLTREVARIAPERKEQVTALIANIEEARRLQPEPVSWTDDALADPEAEILAARQPVLVRDAFASGHPRAGLRIGVGSGLRGPSSRSLTMGAIATFGTGPVAFVTRFDVGQRTAEMRSLTSVAGSVGIAGRMLTTPSFALMLGAAQRVERRMGTTVLDSDRTGLAADVTLDVVARNWPTSLGARFEQGLDHNAQRSSLLFEMSVELR